MIKPIHFTVPRSLAECHFAANADPIERPYKTRMDWQDRVVVWASVAALIATLGVVLS